MIVFLPTLITIILVMLTRKVILALLIGIILSAFVIADFQISITTHLLWTNFTQLFINDGRLNTSNLYLLLFIILLGAIAQILLQSGSSKAFANWALRFATSKKAAERMTWGLGLAAFINGYFSAAVAGEVSKPLAKQHKISAAKLAYIVDSTAAPVSVLVPLSTWGPYILGILGTVFMAHEIQTNVFSSYLQLIPMQFYAINAIVLVLLTIQFDVRLPPMRAFDAIALKENPHEDLSADNPTRRAGQCATFVQGIGTVIGITLLTIVIFGIQGSPNSVTWASIIQHADIAASLVLGAIAGLIVVIWGSRQVFSFAEVLRISLLGVKALSLPVAILILAWMMTLLANQIGMGSYIADKIALTEFNTLLWFIGLMLASAVISFSTGSSAGALGILLPIAASLIIQTNMQPLMIPLLGAVFSGAMIGDHCSPISDTTVVSALMTHCPLRDHFISQLPYALSAGVVTLLGYGIYNFTQSILLSYIIMLFSLLGFCYIKRWRE